MVRRVKSEGVAYRATKNHVDDEALYYGLSPDHVGNLEPEIQDLLRSDVRLLTTQQRLDLNLKINHYLLQKQAQEDRQRSFWNQVRGYFDLLYSGVQSFIRAEKAPTKFSMPPLGQGENLDLWRQRMSRVLQSWRRGRRVDVTQRLTDDGALTVYFDDYGELDDVVTFATRVTRNGRISSIEYVPGQGEVERMVGDQGRQQLKVFFEMLKEHDRGQKSLFRRFLRRMARAPRPARLPSPLPH
jgi:hypothetical protein